MRRIIFISVLALMGCESTGQPRLQPTGPAPVTPGVTEPVQLSDAQLKNIQSAVMNSLKDPDSAKFGEIKGAKSEGMGADLITVCGWVNARNSFGGYTGMSPFMALYSIGAHKSDIVKMGGEEMVNFQIQNRCLAHGVRI